MNVINDWLLTQMYILSLPFVVRNCSPFLQMA